MYARVTTYQADPAQLDAVVAQQLLDAVDCVALGDTPEIEAEPHGWKIESLLAGARKPELSEPRCRQRLGQLRFAGRSVAASRLAPELLERPDCGIKATVAGLPQALG